MPFGVSQVSMGFGPEEGRRDARQLFDLQNHDPCAGLSVVWRESLGPGLHGANWLRGDLHSALAGLGLGEELVLDYRGEVADAPKVAVHRSADDVFTAQGPEGWLKVGGYVQWTWPPSERPGRLEEIGFSLISFLKQRRGARGVILIAPN